VHLAIHMAFDCMAIGMGLFASVMATWEPNERFTYGLVLQICLLKTRSNIFGIVNLDMVESKHYLASRTGSSLF